MISSKNILPVTQVKKSLLKLLSKLQRDGEGVLITKDGKSAGMLLSMDEYEGLIETIEILGDCQILNKLKKSEDDFKKGNIHSFNEVFKE